MHFRKPELIPLLFILAAVGLSSTLGVWQLQRLEWKNALMAEIAQAQEKPPLAALPPQLDGLEYRTAALGGRFLHEKTLRKIGSRQGERPGFFLLTPFKLDDGRILLVNRGFAPEGKAALPEGVAKVTGILRPARSKRAFFIPDNRPDQNVWVYDDIAAMSAYSKLDLLPIVLEVTGAYEQGVYPIPYAGKTQLRNDHLGYAITWFGLAVAALVFFAFYCRVPGKQA